MTLLPIFCSPIDRLVRTAFCFLVSSLVASPSALSQPSPDRPRDQLLSRPALQSVVDAQVDRDGDALITALDADEPNVRARAAFALASVQDTSAIPALLDLLQDGVPIVRTDAAFALTHMPDNVPGERLLEVLRYERDPAMQRRLIAALGHTGDAASQQALLDLGLPDVRDPGVALALARYAMRDITDARATDWLVEHLTTDADDARQYAAYAFGRVDSLAVGRADTLRHALDTYSADDPAAMYLLRALGRQNDPDDGERLTNWLRDGADWRTRVEATRALAGLDTTTHSALVRALNDDHPLVARTAAETLAEADWTSDARTAVGVWISANPDRWRVVAPLLRGLARNNRPGRVLNTLPKWRDEASPFAYAAALPALAYVDRPEADSLLAAATRHEDSRIAAAAVQGISTRWERIRPEKANFYFDALSSAVRSGDPALLYHGASALTDSLFVTRGATDTLAATYRTLSTPDDLEGMTATLEALSNIGSPSALSVLRNALDHPHPTVRQAAATGLSQAADTTITADPRPLPDTPTLDWDYLKTLRPSPQLVLSTNRGEVRIELDTEQAPQTVQAICRFVQEDRYDGVPFHRVVPNFVVQGGDFARRDGFGGPGVFLRTEITRLGHRRGTLGMASAGKNTEGSQFFVPHSLQPHLDGGYTSFGRVVEGMDVIDRLRVGDRITEATVRSTD